LVDEGALQGPLCRLLRRHGYRALEAGDAQDALRRFRDNDCQLDLLIADVCLPVGSGVQVALALRVYLPELGVILASGYPSEMWKARDFTLLGRLGPDSVTILQKPLVPETLLTAIGNLIGGSQSETARTA
jgi:DNA-binding response OmpR family regulator